MTEAIAEPPPQKKRMGWITRILIGGGSLGAVMGIGLALVFAPFKVPSGSMWPTLKVGERVFVNKLAKQPFRGVFVVFRFPEHKKSLFAKRVVGLPGDVVAVDDGVVTINGWKVPRCEVGRASFREEGAAGDSGKHEGVLFVEWLGSARYLVFEEKQSSWPDHQGPFAVKPDEFFVLGDNRKNSHDSRMWFAGQGGGVPFGDAIGRVVGHEDTELPRGAEELAPALAVCLDKRPEQTDPPAPR